ncbi:ChrR family anti-sigma-E factor [Shewanella submarina]|uniref:ChrR family anti-sigma-E factor n=1 Tax=Shewanella submarina TaxID=2016376 RepID=A0ABV7GAA7_9GAMM|nr:ChrR family anti-sigma-E factor [Shewanella submarina]MCL1037585.1 ChrR family anti-sigma-E factor [Shewanella submarina]
MIKYHPSDALLQAHVAGELPLSMSIAVSAHCEMCQVCQDKVHKMNAAFAQETLEAEACTETDLCEFNFDGMLEEIMSKPTAPQEVTPDAMVEVNGEQYKLPKAFRHQLQDSWSGIGKVNRMRFDTAENKARASLLHIGAGGEIPAHTHKGQEITLLLSGDFCDEYNEYHPGDFIVMSSEHEHSPRTHSGCLCYTVVDAPLYFTKGISKLLNPIGELIY